MPAFTTGSASLASKSVARPDALAGDIHIGVTGPLGALYFRAMRRGWRRFLDEFGLSGALQGNPRSVNVKRALQGAFRRFESIYRRAH